MRIEFKVPGKPKGKGRPRFSGGHAYTPKETKQAEEEIAWYYRQEAQGKVFDGPICMQVRMVFPIPKRATVAEKERMRCGEIKPLIKPDADNCLKLCADALNGVAWSDDKQIVYAAVMKGYAKEGDEPCTWINIWEYH